MPKKIIMLELSEEEFYSLLGYLEDDMELHGPYWKTERGQDVQMITKRMQDQAERIRGGQSRIDTRADQEAR